MAKKWRSEDNLKLAELFRKGPSKGGVTTKNTNRQYIKEVLLRHFPERGEEYLTNFAPLFRRKAAKWVVDQEKRKARKRGGKGNYIEMFLFEPQC
jgi:hypothetical protein